MKARTFVITDSGMGSPPTFVIITARGWSCFRISSPACFSVSSTRTTFGPPPVDPAIPPTKKRRISTSLREGAQSS